MFNQYSPRPGQDHQSQRLSKRETTTNPPPTYIKPSKAKEKMKVEKALMLGKPYVPYNITTSSAAPPRAEDSGGTVDAPEVFPNKSSRESIGLVKIWK